MKVSHSDIILLRITAEDIETLQHIGRTVFTESFSWGNTEENLQAYLDEAFSTQKLQEEISEPDSQFYFAMFNGQPVGYIKINIGNAQTELKTDKSLEIERIYVVNKFQGMGIGQFFIDEILIMTRKQKLAFIWLGVWEKNPGAIKFMPGMASNHSINIALC